MEQRISHLRGLDISNPEASRTPIVRGGYFGLESNVPAMLRGPATGFAAAVLFRSTVSSFGETDDFAESEFLVGCRDYNTEEGWAIILEEGELVFQFADLEFSQLIAAGQDYLALMVWDGDAGEVSYYLNGFWLETETPGVPYVQGPDNFGIGGTSDPTFNADDEAWGAVSVMLAGASVGLPVAVGSMIPASPAVEQYASCFSASDVVDSLPSPVPMGVTLPPSSYLWSVRRGLPQLVDNGNETWADQVTGLELRRIGVQQGASVGSHVPNWGAAEFN